MLVGMLDVMSRTMFSQKHEQCNFQLHPRPPAGVTLCAYQVLHAFHLIPSENGARLDDPNFRFTTRHCIILSAWSTKHPPSSRNCIQVHSLPLTVVPNPVLSSRNTTNVAQTTRSSIASVYIASTRDRKWGETTYSPYRPVVPLTAGIVFVR